MKCSLDGYSNWIYVWVYISEKWWWICKTRETNFIQMSRALLSEFLVLALILRERKCKYGILRRGKMTLQLHVVTVLQLSVEEELPLPHHPSSPSKGHLNAHSTNWWYQLGEKRSICTSRWSIFIVLTISTLLRNKLENGDKRRDEVC